MAIFEDNRELSTQKRYVGMDRMKGGNKMLAAAMGYKDTGEKNLWGKMYGPQLTALALGGGMAGFAIADVGSRLVAKQASKGSDAEDVFDETSDEWRAQTIAKAKFGYEATMLGAKAVSGTMGDGGGLDTSGMSGGSSPSLSTGGIVADNVAKGGTNNIADSDAGKNLTTKVEADGTASAKDVLDSAVSGIDNGTMSDTELLKNVGKQSLDYYKDGTMENADGTLDMSQYEERGFENWDELTDEQKKLLKEQKRLKKIEKTANLLDQIPEAGKTLSTGLELVAANRNLNQATKREVEKHMKKTANDPQFNLL